MLVQSTPSTPQRPQRSPAEYEVFVCDASFHPLLAANVVKMGGGNSSSKDFNAIHKAEITKAPNVNADRAASTYARTPRAITAQEARRNGPRRMNTAPGKDDRGQADRNTGGRDEPASSSHKQDQRRHPNEFEQQPPAPPAAPDRTVTAMHKQVERLRMEKNELEQTIKDLYRHVEARQQLNDVLQSEREEHHKTKAEYDEYKSTTAKISIEKGELAKERQRLNVLYQAERQENVKLQAECYRYKAAFDEIVRPLPGQNIQAEYLSINPEIQEEIKHTLTVRVSELVEDMYEQLGTHAFVLPHLLARVFVESQALVEKRRKEVYAFFLCGSDVCKEAIDMDQRTADFMLKHTRLHYKDIFPLTGEYVEGACDTIVERLEIWTSGRLEGVSRKEAAKLLEGARLREVIKKYLYVFVCATLQEPRTEFEEDCGQEQGFDPKRHAPSIDGDALQPGDKCVVIFPALKAELSDKRFILRALPP